MSTEPKRLQKQAVHKMQARLEKAGYTVSYSNFSLYMWSTEGFYLGFFQWNTKLGWTFCVAHPVVHTEDEFDMALEELDRSLTALREAQPKWHAYKKSKSRRRWREYLGVIAGYQMRDVT
jgi:hypothetical protein